MSYSQEGGSIRAIFYALGANGGIAIAKFAAAFYTSSGAMLAEAIHSLADCTNQIFLLIGLKQARRPLDDEHPLGYARVVYFWAMMVALLLFFLGGAFSVYEGIERLLHAEPIKAPLVAMLVLGFSVVLEGFSLWGALREIKKLRGSKPLWRWFRETRQSELMVVFGEDIAALAGLAVAFLAVILTVITGNPMFDALGSLVVGVLLMLVAYGVLREVKAMIVGESADPETRAAIRAFLQQQPEIKHIISLITLQWGEQLVVAVQAEMQTQPSAQALIDAINRVEADLQQTFPQAKWVFFEPDVAD